MIEYIAITQILHSKKDLDMLIHSSNVIPENELHILKKTNCSEQLDEFLHQGDYYASIALLTNPTNTLEDYNVTKLLIGYIERAYIVYNDIQHAPLMVNFKMSPEQEYYFQNDEDLPLSYEIQLIIPPISLSEFILSKNVFVPDKIQDTETSGF